MIFLVIGLAMLLLLLSLVLLLMYDNTTLNNFIITIVALSYLTTALLFVVYGLIDIFVPGVS